MTRLTWAVLGCVLVAARPAAAVPYETFVDIDSEQDVQDLLAAQDLTQDTFDELLDLLDAGVDLNTADRSELYTLPNLTYEDVDKILAFRDAQHGYIKDPADLVSAGALTQEKLLSIAAFLVVRPPGDNPLLVHGRLSAVTRGTLGDDRAPPVGLRGRFTLLKHLTLGFAATSTRLWIEDPVYDPNRGALIAKPESYQIHVPKVFVKWEDDQMTAILGSFRAGFGQRLTFDNSRHYTPNGLYLDDQLFYAGDLSRECKQSAGELLDSPCAGSAAGQYTTPDFVWRDGLFGGAIGAKHVEVGAGWMQGYAFASASRRSLYEYELVDRGKCADPRNDDDVACGAPTVFVQPPGNILTPTTRYAYETLPNMFEERLVGGNVAFFADRRTSVGVTAYGASETNLVDGIDLDFQEWSRLPFGRKFGAAGANFSYGQGWLDVTGEAALSVDSMPKPDNTTPTNATAANGGGGPAAILRATATAKHQELEVVARYYSTDYLNPYARPISAADEFEGQRTRDEAGGRLRYLWFNHDIQIRSLLDIWVNPSTNTPKLDTYVRANFRTTDELWLGLWERYQDKDLTRGGHDQCFEVSTQNDENGEPILCGGRQITTIARAHYTPRRDLTATLMLEHQLLDDNSQSSTSFRTDLAAWVIALYKPTATLRVRARVRFLDEAIASSTFGETSLATSVDVGTVIRGVDRLRVRIDSKFWLDDRRTTPDRDPNPELSLWLMYEAHL